VILGVGPLAAGAAEHDLADDAVFGVEFVVVIGTVRVREAGSVLRLTIGRTLTLGHASAANLLPTTSEHDMVTDRYFTQLSSLKWFVMTRVLIQILVRD